MIERSSDFAPIVVGAMAGASMYAGSVTWRNLAATPGIYRALAAIVAIVATAVFLFTLNDVLWHAGLSRAA